MQETRRFQVMRVRLAGAIRRAGAAGGCPACPVVAFVEAAR